MWAAARTLVAWTIVIGQAVVPANGAAAAGTVRIPAGSYRPLYGRPSRPDTGGPSPRVDVAAFAMDAHAVTNAEYLAFVRAHPEWRRSRVSALVADAGYLRHWAGDLDLGADAPPDSPVVNVSWFAARAYLHASGRELPTVDQWEYVAAASAARRDASDDPRFLADLRRAYGQPLPGRLPAAASLPANVYGVAGMHGPVREWTLDFNSALVTGESRADGALDRSLYCAAGAFGATRMQDYAAFMRYAFRGSLEARYTVGTLGFRGVVAGTRHGGPTVPATLTGARSIYDLDIPLIDADGRRASPSDLRGRVVVASMIYTSCTAICPGIAEDMKAIERRLPAAQRAAVSFALFSIDPRRDTPQALARFAAERGLARPGWRLFATSEDGVRTLAAVLGARYAPEPAGGIAHSALIVVIDRDGVLRHRQVGVSSGVDAVVRAVADAGR